MSCKIEGPKIWLLSVLCLTMLPASASHLLSAENKPGNYKLVPNLQEMDHTPAPLFTLSTLEGGKVALKEFRGKLLMLNFWASWCVSCREEMPAMERLYQRYKDQHFVILGVNIKDEKKSAISFVKELKITFPIAFDPKGEVGLVYGAWGIPTTYLIDDNGLALARVVGSADWYNPGARELVKKILDQQK